MPGTRHLKVRDLGRLGWAEAYAVQRELVEQRKQSLISDQLLFVEHPHTVTLGRNGHEANILANPEMLRRAGIVFHQTNRGGDATYHGPGQVVGYPIFDLREWKRDVMAFVRTLEQAVIDTLNFDFGIESWREPGATGVWTAHGKICAIGVHISRWVTCHGFALNHTTDLSYFRYIVPCGLAKPVTSMEALGGDVHRCEVQAALTARFIKHFGHQQEISKQEIATEANRDGLCEPPVAAEHSTPITREHFAPHADFSEELVLTETK